MITYRHDLNCWWPDYDHNPTACHAKVMRRLNDATLWMRYRKERRSVVQAGGHCGFWPLKLSDYAKVVYTFEPDPACYQALVKNVDGIYNIRHSMCGLGANNKISGLSLRSSAGSSQVNEQGSIPIALLTIDSLKLDDCDAIILDVEGYEVEALEGAKETIQRCRPIIHLEDSNVAAQDEWMRANGYEFVFKCHSDRLFRSII